LFLASAQISSPYGSDFKRNPANKNSGKFVLLSEFLELAKAKAVTGILINIEVISMHSNLTIIKN